ncbi:WD40-repeat-containing domain protein [Chytriomyces cf. hyalinus JEL632]|nr:WD40-repeat-containing domain protein [Chytriomyces cf. hyalinus JEL632]
MHLQNEGNALHKLTTQQQNERVRLVAQMLMDIGHGSVAQKLLSDAGIPFEAPEAESLRHALLNGEWANAEGVLQRIQAEGMLHEGVKDAILAVRLQKYLELLESGDAKAALRVLRTDITPLCSDHAYLQRLSSLIMCSNVHLLKEKADWDGRAGSSRSKLLSKVQKCVAMDSMMPEARLESLLTQAIHHQTRNCLYHNVPDESISLFNDHSCDRSEFPTKTTHILDGHSDEVWFVSFSPDGKLLASASKDSTAIVWDITTFEPRHKFQGHTDHISVVAWSTDSAFLLTGSNDHSIKLWKIQTGVCVSTFTAHTDTITSLAFIPPSKQEPNPCRFVSSSMDKFVILWNMDGQVLHKWHGVRVTDLTVTSDGSRMVTISDRRIRIFDLASKEELGSESESDAITSIAPSNDAQHVLVNVSGSQEIHLWNVIEGRIVRRFLGHKQGRFVIRSCFGGLFQNFVLSGSEDANVYIWNRELGVLLECLQGHTATVNSVSWNSMLNIFATASDDHTIRIWGVGK